MSHALSAGADLVAATQRFHVRGAWQRQGSPPIEGGDNQRPERTGAGVRKPSPESFVPGDNLPGEVGGINCAGDMGVRRRLARSLTSLALRCALQKRERSP